MVIAIVIGKALIIWLLMRLFGETHHNALMTGLCLAQVGEFSFVIAATARGTLIDEEQFLLVVSATIGTLFLTPYLVAGAPRGAQAILRALERARLVRAAAPALAPDDAPPHDHIIIIGYGPAGQSVSHTLLAYGSRVCIVDLNRAAIDAARPLGFRAYVGDAAHAEMLEHLNVADATAVIVTVPDPTAARNVITLIKSLAPDTLVLARARYHVYRWELEYAGAEVVIDEERQVGYELSEHLRRHLSGESRKPES
jgi:CPA2 family monovalent cation:H+ antiporter-2